MFTLGFVHAIADPSPRRMTHDHQPPPPAPSSPLRAAVRLPLILVAGVVWILAYLAGRPVFSGDRRRALAYAQRATGRWSRALARAAGIEVRVSGPPPPPGALLAANHVNYGDIAAIGSAVDCLFLAKDEVGTWPGIGPAMRAAHHCLVRRERTRALRAATEMVAERLAHGARVCVFLEGTTSDGSVLPFVPSFLQPALATGAPVVPVAVRWTCDDPAVVPARDLAWVNNFPLGMHVWRFAGRRGVRVEVTFGDPIAVEGRSRRDLAAEAEGCVRAMLGQPAPARTAACASG
jgi:1-acyl-sn-glycerol-3-phosphate acyltransferase